MQEGCGIPSAYEFMAECPVSSSVKVQSGSQEPGSVTGFGLIGKDGQNVAVCELRMNMWEMVGQESFEYVLLPRIVFIFHIAIFLGNFEVF